MNPSPWHNPWREELRALLNRFPARRAPALRRSREADWLFATDLPCCAEESVCADFLRSAEAAGWISARENGWIHLRKAEPVPPEGLFPSPLSGEADCLRALLSRHPGSADPARELILLCKAREEGPDAWEKACRSLHQDFAGRLRRREALPRIEMEE